MWRFVLNGHRLLENKQCPADWFFCQLLLLLAKKVFCFWFFGFCFLQRKGGQVGGVHAWWACLKSCSRNEICSVARREISKQSGTGGGEKVGGESRKSRAEREIEGEEGRKGRSRAETKSLGRKFLATEIYKIYV